MMRILLSEAENHHKAIILELKSSCKGVYSSLPLSILQTRREKCNGGAEFCNRKDLFEDLQV